LEYYTNLKFFIGTQFLKLKPKTIKQNRQKAFPNLKKIISFIKKISLKNKCHIFYPKRISTRIKRKAIRSRIFPSLTEISFFDWEKK
jgi:hypothetical protein